MQRQRFYPPSRSSPWRGCSWAISAFPHEVVRLAFFTSFFHSADPFVWHGRDLARVTGRGPPVEFLREMPHVVVASSQGVGQCHGGYFGVHGQSGPLGVDAVVDAEGDAHALGPGLAEVLGDELRFH